MLALIVWFLIAVIVLLILYRVIGMFVSDPKIMQLVGLLLAVLLVAWLISAISGYGPGPHFRIN